MMALVLGSIAILFFPVWYGPLMAITRAIRRRARPEQGQVEVGIQPA